MKRTQLKLMTNYKMPNMKFKIIQWNCRGLKSKRYEFSKLLEDYDPDIVLLNETWLDSLDNISALTKMLSGSNRIMLRADRNHRSPNESTHGGSAIIVRSNIPISHIKHFNTASSEWLCVSIQNGTKQLNIATGYSSPKHSLDLGFLTECFQDPCIFAGDLNCWHPELSGDQEANKSGLETWNWLQALNGTVINNGHPVPTRFKDGIGRQLDIWFHSASFVNSKISNFLVGDRYGSDHYMTFIELAYNQTRLIPQQSLASTRFLFAKANWHRYREELNQHLNALKIPRQGDNSTEIDVYAAGIEKAMLSAAVNTIPKGPAAKIPKWKLNTHIGQALEIKNKLERQLDRNPNLMWLKDEVKAAKIKVNTLIGKEIAKENGIFISRLAAQLERTNNPDNRSWRAISSKLGKRQNRRAIPTLNTANGAAASDLEKATAIGSNIAKTVSGAPSPPALNNDRNENNFWHQTEHETKKLTPLAIIPAFNVQLKPNMLRSTILRLKNKAPGIDSIPNVLIKKGGKSLLSHLANLFNASLNAGFVPSNWKVAIVVPILKEGKNPNDPASYRPVSLLPALAKLLETIIANFLYSRADILHLLPNHQAGFRRNRCTTDPLEHLLSNIASAMENKKRLAAVFIDFKAAFDSIWHAGLLIKLENHLPLWLVRWTADFLRGRCFKTRVGNCFSEKFNMYSGVPQGSPLSPVLFILFLADLLPLSTCNDNSRAVAVGSYADDVAIWSTSHNLGVLQKRLQSKLDFITKWCHKWKLAVNPTKCETIVFGHSGRHPPALLLRIGNKDIPQSRKVKYLGVILSTKLGFEHHLNLISSKIKWRIGALKNLSRKVKCPFWIKLVNIYIGSVITYAAPAWFPLTSDSARKRLLRFQGEALCAATGRLPLLPDDCFHELLNICNTTSILETMNNLTEKYLNRNTIDNLHINPLNSNY